MAWKCDKTTPQPKLRRYWYQIWCELSWGLTFHSHKISAFHHLYKWHKLWRKNGVNSQNSPFFNFGSWYFDITWFLFHKKWFVTIEEGVEGITYHFCKVFASFDHKFGVNGMNGVNGKTTFWSFLSPWYTALRKHEIWHHNIFLAFDQSRKELPFQNRPRLA